MPQGYDKPLTNTGSPTQLRQALGYVPARLMKARAGGGDSSGSGIIISGGPSNPVISSGRVQVRTEAATSYTLAPADLYYYIVFTAATAVTITVPAGMDWDLDTIVPVFAFEQGGAGQLSVVGGGGATVRTPSIFYPRSHSQYSVLQLIQRGTDDFTLFGTLELV